MRFLCVCEGGNVRSVGLAFILKHLHSQEALACGWHFTEDDTLHMLYKWADVIITMESYMTERIPKKFRRKLGVVDVGPDRFGSPFHPELQQILVSVVAEWKKRDWKVLEPETKPKT